MEDDNSMSERILRSLETIVNNDPNLKEFVVVPAEANTKNKSPVLYEEHNIGLESWCVKHIYRYAYLELFEARKLLLKKKLPFNKERSLNHLLIGVLLINPDVSTFWNVKRELVERDVLSVNNELLFTKLVLSSKSKSNEAFAYRRWLLNRALAKLQKNDMRALQSLFDGEMSVCEMAAAKNANNYHAWTHRIWSFETIGHRMANFSVLMLRELEFSQQWLSQHVSEHTGYHYRQYLLNAVRNSKKITCVFEYYYSKVVESLGLVNENDPKDILTLLLGKEKSCKPLEETNNLINSFSLLLFDLHNTVDMLNSIFPNHEALWYHRRYLLHHLIKTAYEYHGLSFKMNEKLDDVALHGTNIVNMENSGFSDGEKQPKLFKTQPNRVESSLFYQSLVKTESEFIKKNLTGALHLARRYEKWLQFVFCMKDV
ncbi:protein prenyltransferase alpha subunit repeat-containing protein 1 [Zophobas morio]|uniref:protein prenyltransferase alpha subunit repeat-containing protein 1 n=1 Tax=Zophobas morio TaxID=2755281 RepID=UPI003082F98B